MASAGHVETLPTCAKAQERRAMLPDGIFRRLFPAEHETNKLCDLSNFGYVDLDRECMCACIWVCTRVCVCAGADPEVEEGGAETQI